MNSESDICLNTVLVAAIVSLLVSFTISFVIGVHFFRKYPQRQALDHEHAFSNLVSMFFMLMTFGYTGVSVYLGQGLDSIVLTIFVAAVFGNVVGAKATEVLQKAGKK